jgi:hypothetical protein
MTHTGLSPGRKTLMAKFLDQSLCSKVESNRERERVKEKKEEEEEEEEAWRKDWVTSCFSQLQQSVSKWATRVFLGCVIRWLGQGRMAGFAGASWEWEVGSCVCVCGVCVFVYMCET